MADGLSQMIPKNITKDATCPSKCYYSRIHQLAGSSKVHLNETSEVNESSQDQKLTMAKKEQNQSLKALCSPVV